MMNDALELGLVRVTEAAALAAAPWVGRGDKMAADQAAVDAMRRALNSLPISGTVVIGEGEQDEAPMLYIGEKLGAGGAAVDIAVDPLDGTTMVAKGGPNALAVIAVAPRGGLLHAPDMYMDKIAIGAGYPIGIISLAMTPEENIRALAKAKGCAPRDVTVCLLDRERHAPILAAVRKLDARLVLIGDGDIAAAIATAQTGSGIDIYMGSGGAPEGVLAAAALRCLGGQFEGRLMVEDDAQRARIARMGIADADRIFALNDLVKGDVMFAATGVTDGTWLRGVHGRTTQTVVMNSAAGTVRMVDTTVRCS